MNDVSELRQRHFEINDEVRILNFAMSRISGLHKNLKHLIDDKAFKVIQDEFLLLHESKQEYLKEASEVEAMLRKQGLL